MPAGTSSRTGPRRRDASRRAPAAAILFGLACWLLLALPLRSQSSTSPRIAPEPALKAALLFKLLPYVQWPTNTFVSSNAPIVITVVQAPDLARELETLATGTAADGHPIEIRRDAPRDWSGVHVAYVGRPGREDVRSITSKTAGLPVLVVGDEEGLAEAGGIVNLTIRGRLPHLEISRENAAARGIRFSSRLGTLRSIDWIPPRGKP